MILVIGGIAQGKTTYIHSLGYNSADIALNTLCNSKPVLYGLEEILRTELDVDKVCKYAQSYEVVTCLEVGCGIVPASHEERAWRERVGRTSIRLAQEADTVVRLVCGIPVCLKGTLPHADVM